MPAAKRVLLVGAACEWLPGLGSNTQKTEAWTSLSVQSAWKALALLGEEPFDAVVASASLKEMNGTQFLDEVMRRHPKTVRFLATNLADNCSSALSGVGTTHHLLTLPLDWPSLQEALQQAIQPDPWAPAESAQELLARFRHLPSPPSLYFEVVNELESDNASLQRVGELVSRDMIMTAKLLQVVNSALFGLKVRVADASDAVLYLGIETTKALLLLAHTFSYFDDLKPSGLSVENLWNHSLLAGQLARRIAEAEGMDQLNRNLSFTAGLLHDLGKLALAVNLPQPYAQSIHLARCNHILTWEAEQTTFGMTHGEIGACLLNIWGLPECLVEAVALHHFPSNLLNRQFAPLTAVHVADVFAHEQQPGNLEPTPLPDIEYLANLGLNLRLEEWRECCRPGAID